MGQRVKVEICVGDIVSAIAADTGGADRVELCDNLTVGGTTPSTGTIIESCRRLSIAVHVLIRPRAGDFVYSEPEIAVMRRDIEIAKASGAAGIVLGVLTPDSAIDRDLAAELITTARPLSVTFHKAFDQIAHQLAALETLIELGVDRVLTSGGQALAVDGAEMLASLVDFAGNKITIMAGGGLKLADVKKVISRSRVPEIHIGSAASRTIDRADSRPPRHGDESGWTETDAERVAAIATVVHGLSAEP
jgi:copper homeostasis protein